MRSLPHACSTLMALVTLRRELALALMSASPIVVIHVLREVIVRPSVAWMELIHGQSRIGSRGLVETGGYLIVIARGRVVVIVATRARLRLTDRARAASVVRDASTIVTLSQTVRVTPALVGILLLSQAQSR